MRQLLRKALAQQQACGGLLLEHEGLCWSSTSWKATGANLVVDAGQLIIEIGMCPVKPAEFVVFRIGQMPAGGDVSE